LKTWLRLGRIVGRDNAGLLDRLCGQEEPFDVILGGMETFIPVTPTVYIRVEGASRLCDLHNRLNTGALAFREEWPYIPHVTLVKMSAEEPAKNAFEFARERWDGYAGSRRVPLENLTFVREDDQNCWVDVAPVPLGRTLVPR